jgi:spermidine/putrescine transport system substrate-binding protein
MRIQQKIARGIVLTVSLTAFSLLTGCKEETPAITEAHDLGGEASTTRSKSVKVLTYDEYFCEDVIHAFEEESGVKVEFITFANLDEMEALLRSRPVEFDLVVTDGGTLADLIELQLIQPINLSKLPNFPNLDSRFLDLAFDRGNKYSVPYMWGTTLIAYRSDKIENPEKSWRALWNKDYRGRVLMVDDGFDTYAAALLAAGHDLNSADETHIASATEMLVGQVDELDARFVDIFEIRDQLLSGECWISMTYSSDAAVLTDEEENISYFIPEEGAPLWLDSFVIPRESRNIESAYQFLDYLCRAEVGAANSNELWCASANSAARPFLSDEILEDDTLYLSDEVLARCQFDKKSSPARHLLLNQGLKRVFDRVREVSERPELSLLIWEEYIAPSVIEGFTLETGVRVAVTEIDNSEQFKQAFASKPDGFDVVVADEKTMKELMDLRLLAELDGEKLGAGAGRLEPFLTSAFDPGNRFTIPYHWGLTVLAGKSGIPSGADHSWSLLWREDLEIALLDEPADIMWVALLALGYNPAAATEAQIDEAAAKLAQRFPDITRVMNDQVTVLDKLEAGEVDLVMTYNGDALTRMATFPGMEVVVPREGAPLWLDSFAISRDAPNAALAHQFIAYMTRPEISARSTAELNYASPNLAALPLIDETLLENLSLYSGPELIEKCSFVRFPAEAEKYARQTMLALISGSRSRTYAIEAAKRETAARLQEGTTD